MSNAPAEKPSSNYSNSHKAKETAKETPNFEKVIVGEVITRKKPLGTRIKEAFTGDDSRSVGHFILFDVVLPATKQLISDVASQGVERLLFGDNARSSTVRRGGYSNTYNRVSTNNVRIREREEPRAISQRARATHEFSEVVLADRPEAQRVLDDLTAAIDQYDTVTVSDLYDLLGITGTFQDDKWGWYELRDARIVRVREGYLLDLPKPQPMN